MHTQRILTLRIDKDIDCVFWVRMHIAPHEARLVGADGDEAEIEGAAQGTDLSEGRADGEVCVDVVVGGVGGESAGDGAVACIAVW